MAPNIHLITVVGSFVKQLPHMLEHYRELGVCSIFLNVQVNCPDDPLLATVEEIAARYRCRIALVAHGDWQDLLARMYALARESKPNDWFILADQDELQLYPDDLSEVIKYCEQRGHDYIRGVVIDRISADGGFPELEDEEKIWQQFPLGGLITYVILGAQIRKVVAAKGGIPLVQGQHFALKGRGCPVRDCLVQVHHFKWIKGLIQRLEERVEQFKKGGRPHWVESQRFVSYYYSHGGRIQLDDPRLLICECDRDYKYWPLVQKISERWMKAVRW